MNLNINLKLLHKNINSLQTIKISIIIKMSQNINYCQVLDCESNKDIRTFTPGAKKKSQEKETLYV